MLLKNNLELILTFYIKDNHAYELNSYIFMYLSYKRNLHFYFLKISLNLSQGMITVR